MTLRHRTAALLFLVQPTNVVAQDVVELLKDCDECTIEQREFSDLNLPALSLKGAVLNGVAFTRTRLFASDFSYARLTDVSFDGVNLRGANFTGSVLRNVSFLGADLSGAIFDDARLDGTDLGQAKLCNTQLPGDVMGNDSC